MVEGEENRSSVEVKEELTTTGKTARLIFLLGALSSVATFLAE
jgi:hypothetical protein